MELEPGLVLVTGPNGAGKTNLLEAVHVGLQGFSPRTRHDAQLIRHGAAAAAVRLRGGQDRVDFATEAVLARGEGRRLTVNGARVSSGEELRARFAVLAFTPDRLAVVKAGPAARRAYFDRTLARLFPARARLPLDYAAAVGQRGAALRRVALGRSAADALAPWTAQVAALGAALVEARREAVAVLAPAFLDCAGELGLPAARLVYEGEAPTESELEARLQRDLERGTTSLGPHLHEYLLLSLDRDLRLYGSQGEQRLAVLSLLLAEAAVVAERGGAAPLLLLDDALSELDAARRRVLSERLGRSGQTIVTATGSESLPLAPAQLLAVTPGEVRAA